MDKKIIKFDGIVIEEHEFHQHEKLISIKDIDINKIVVFNKLPLGKKDCKYFIGYKDAGKLDLYAYSIQKWVCRKEIFIKPGFRSFLIKEEKIFDKYNEILKEVSNIIKKRFNSKLVYNKKYLNINTKEGFQCFYASVILIDSVYRKDETYYPKVFLENYNFNDYIEIYSDEEYSDNSDEKIQINKIKCIYLYLEKTS